MFFFFMNVTFVTLRFIVNYYIALSIICQSETKYYIALCFICQSETKIL